jgi:hypothetical protein
VTRIGEQLKSQRREKHGNYIYFTINPLRVSETGREKNLKPEGRKKKGRENLKEIKKKTKQ